MHGKVTERYSFPEIDTASWDSNSTFEFDPEEDESSSSGHQGSWSGLTGLWNEMSPIMYMARLNVESVLKKNIGSHNFRFPKLPYPTPEKKDTVCNLARECKINDLQSLHSTKLNVVDKYGNTPLIYAAEKGHYQVIKYLLDSNVQVCKQGFLGNTALSRAIRAGQVEIVRMILDHGGLESINCENHKMQSPLHVAAYREQSEIIELLLQYGADINVIDAKGRMPEEDTKSEEIKLLFRRLRQDIPCEEEVFRSQEQQERNRRLVSEESVESKSPHFLLPKRVRKIQLGPSEYRSTITSLI